MGSRGWTPGIRSSAYQELDLVGPHLTSAHRVHETILKGQFDKLERELARRQRHRRDLGPVLASSAMA